MSNDKRITIAKIAGAHGVKGLAKIYPFGEDITLLETCEAFTDDGKPVKIKLKTTSGKFILAEIDIITTREEAESLKGTELQIYQSALPDIDEDDTYYYHDLVGLKAIGEDGEEIGSVISVDNYGAGDLLEIRTLAGDKYLLPFTNDYVPNVDINNKQVTIIPMEEI